MTPGPSPALEQALAARQAPSLFGHLREQPLPDDLRLLLRIAAGDVEAIDLARRISAEAGPVLTEAAVLFIQQAMFFPGSDSYRVLGVASDASDEQIRDHRRWLVRWLHPDRNVDQWDSVYADRVSNAWQDLRTPERRRDYDLQPRPALPAVSSPQALARIDLRPMARAGRVDAFQLTSRTTRRLPFFILGGLGLASAAALGLQYYATREEFRGEAVAIEVPARVVELAAAPVAPVATAVTEVTVADAPLADGMAPSVPAVAVARMLPPPTRMPAPVAKARQAPAQAVQAVANVRPETVAVLLPAAGVGIAAEAAPTEVRLPSMIDEAGAREIIARFRSAYASGEIGRMREMMLRDGTSVAGGRAEVLRSYGRLFNTSSHRRIELLDPVWLTNGDTAILLAQYQAWIRPRGEREDQCFQGGIRFDLRPEEGQLRIARLRHDATGCGLR